MNCYISMHSPNTAKRHVDELMGRMGFTDWAVGTGRGKVATFFRKLFSMVNLLLKLKRGDVLVIQYPFKKFFVIQCNIARLKGAKTVTLIHDLGTFRRRKLTAEKEVKRLSHTDVIIVHNQCMNDWLTEHGCRVPLVNLDIFDYLSTEEPLTLNPQLSTLNPQPSTLNSQLSTVNSSLPPGGVGGGSHLPTIAFAGGISQRKTGFLYQVDGVLDGCHFDLYGAGLIPGTEREWRNTTYHGQIDSDEFIRTTTADWGLVWDGDSIDGCSGTWGSYLRINNPHKASFCLRAGLPVIVWKESAMAPFITSQRVGITVDSLRELPERLRHISQTEYDGYKRAAMAMKDRLNQGFYFRKAFESALQRLG